MAGKVLEIQNILTRDRLAVEISNRYQDWEMQRNSWLEEKKEIRNYVFATDTTKTTNSKLPWKNKTTIPKICQIRDNLHANYLSALFPNDDWMRWEGYDEESETVSKRKAIQAFISNKLRESNFRTTISQLLYDYIDYGNAFAEIVYVTDSKTDLETGEQIPGYVGPMLKRISPYDIVFNPAAASFSESPKITRYIKTLGELKEELDSRPELGYNKDIISKIEQNRANLAKYSTTDINKAVGYRIDGFGDLAAYYQSGFVEILEFEGDIHDQETGKLLKDQIITIIDRSEVIRKETNPSWFGHSSKIHVGWRLRPDNLYAMGPLDNLVGMQYRIDHLENLKADIFDLIAHPPLKVKGDVDDFEWAPGEMIFMGEDGDVAALTIDTAAVNADTQIAILEQRMEEMAGAPRQAMGIRTPGEKTAFEVQTLENAAGRIFQEKITNFEINLEEPALNQMLEISRRLMDMPDIIRIMDDELGVADFMRITKEDITATGKLRPIGARHFAARAQLVQNMNSIFNSKWGELIAPHVSSVALAKMTEDLFGVGRFGLVRENIQVIEQAQTQKVVNEFKQTLQNESQQNITPTESDIATIQEQNAIKSQL